MIERIKELSKTLPDIAYKVSTGQLSRNFGPERIIFKAPEVGIISIPRTAWSRAVDAVEKPFAPDYDGEEYNAYQALALMGLLETRGMLSAFGIRPSKQTDYENSPLAGKRFAVIGTGPGKEVVALAALGAEVVGFDQTKEYVDIAAGKVQTASNQLGKALNVSLDQCSAENYPYQPNSLDGATSLFGVLNHVENWSGTISKIGSAIKPGGKFVFSMYGTDDALVFREKKIDDELDPSVIQRRVNGGLILGEDGKTVLPANFPTPSEIRSTFLNSGFSIKEERGYLRIASLFPKYPTSENLEEFKKLVAKIDPNALKAISEYERPEEILLAALLYDQRNQQNLEDFAYVFYVAEKK